MSLREEIAEALYEAHWFPTSIRTGREVSPFSKQEGANLEAWLYAADECLRQMRWARASMPDYYMKEEPLTLAPKDWKP